MLPRGKLIYPLCFPFNFNSDTDYLARIHRPHFCWAKARFLIIERKTPQRCQTWHMGGLQVLYNTKPRSNLVRPKQGYRPAKTFLVRWVLRRSRAEPHYSGDQSVLDHVVVTVVNWPRGPGKKQYNWTEVKQENDGRGAGGWGSGGRSQREKPPALNRTRFSSSQLPLFLCLRVSIPMASSTKFQL